MIPILNKIPSSELYNRNVIPGVHLIKGNELNEVQANYAIPYSEEHFMKDNIRSIPMYIPHMSATIRDISNKNRIVNNNVPNKFTTNIFSSKNKSFASPTATNDVACRKILPKDNNLIKTKTGRAHPKNNCLVRQNNLLLPSDGKQAVLKMRK